MNDAQRYRLNAVECLTAAQRRESPYHNLAFNIAACWLSLAREQELVDGLLVDGGEDRSATTVSSQQSFILSTFTSPHSPLPPAGGYVAIQVGCDASAL
jgi:hypothetical protein